MTFSHEERQKAEAMFTAHNRTKGALLPGGFGFLGKKQQQPWLEAARKILSETASN